jgi:hypothetical protein
MNVVTSYQNFAQGQADHDMQGRFDLPIYFTALDRCFQFYTDFKGNFHYREGFEIVYEFQDCFFQEFRFSNNQNYLLCFYANTIRFLSYDSNNNLGWVLDGGSPLEVYTPYTLEESKELDFTQNRDVLTITHKNHLPTELTRRAANAFELTVPNFLGDPFDVTLDSSKGITVITQANPAQVTATAHGYSNGDVVKITSVGGMTEVNNKFFIVEVVDADNYTIGVDSTAYTAYTSGGGGEKVDTFDAPALCEYYKGRRYFGRTPTRPTTIFASESGIYDNYVLPGTITAASPFILSLTDVSEQLEWLFGGDNSMIVGAGDGVVALNSGSVTEPISAETVEGNITKAEAVSSAQPLRKDSEVFYVGNTKRNIYAFSYDLLSESFLSQDVNVIGHDITESGVDKIRYKKDRYNLIWQKKANGNLLSLAYYKSSNEVIRGWHEHATEGTFEDIAVIKDNNGDPKLFALVNRGGTYYIEVKAEPVEFVKLHNFYSGEDKKDEDRDAWYRKVAEQLKQCIYLDNAETFSNLQEANTITYDEGAGTVTASSSVFSSGDVGKHIVYKTSTGYESGRFKITGYTSGTVVDVDVLQTPTSNTYDDWYLTFSSISGISRFNGKTVKIVTDGSVLGEYTISGGEQDLGQQVTHVVIGYGYRGLLKSFPMGFVSRGRNTQMTMKEINRVGLRCTTSLGGMFGTSMYRMQPVQKMTSLDLNYLPPYPIDRTIFVDMVDENEKDKYWYFVQDDPVPFTGNAIMIDGVFTP